MAYLTFSLAFKSIMMQKSNAKYFVCYQKEYLLPSLKIPAKL